MFKQCVVFMLSFVLMSGCGFHLRGAFAFPMYFQSLQILPNQPYDSFQLALKQILKNNHVKIVDAMLTKTKRTSTLFILSQGFSEQTIAYGSEGQINRINLQFNICYQLIDPNGKIITKNGTVQTEREITMNQNAVLSTENEHDRLKLDLYTDGALQLVRQLSLNQSYNIITMP